jgi:hypothetical protein
MDEWWQTIAVGVVILLAVAYLVRYARKGSCEKGSCGCDAKKLAEKGRRDAK